MSSPGCRTAAPVILIIFEPSAYQIEYFLQLWDGKNFNHLVKAKDFDKVYQKRYLTSIPTLSM